MFRAGFSTGTRITGNESLRKYPLAPEFIAEGCADNAAAFAGVRSVDGSIMRGASNLKEPIPSESANHSSLSPVGQSAGRSMGAAMATVDRLRPLATSAAARIE
jgi:hypothetical protein